MIVVVLDEPEALPDDINRIYFITVGFTFAE